MRFDLANSSRGYSGTIEVHLLGANVMLAQIEWVRFYAIDSLEIRVVSYGSHTSLLLLSGRRSGSRMEGTFAGLGVEPGLAGRGSWVAWKTILDPVLFGQWKWVKSVGGIAGVELTPPPEQHLAFGPDGTVARYRDGTLVLSTNYTIVREVQPLFGPDTLDVIHYSGSSLSQAFTIQHASLILSDQCIDCFVHLYTRIRTP
jgi:hypothetical protein